MIRTRFTVLAAVAAVSLIAACAPGFDKPGVSESRIEADKKQCTRTVMWTRHGYESRRYVSRVPVVDKDCMGRLGYTVR